MNERELRRALEDAAPEDPAARDRAWRLVDAAYRDHVARVPRRRWRAAATVAALAVVSAVAGTAAAAPDSGVGEFVRDVLGIDNARDGLVAVPGGGQLLVQAAGSTWVVADDGARRRLGAYDGASWSPHGRFVIAWRGPELTAVTPGGTVRWSLSGSREVGTARWAPVDGFRIAYLAGSTLRIVNGDGTGDRRYGPARDEVAPAWRPDNRHVLAYVDRAGRVDVVAVDSQTRIWRSAPVPGVTALAWSADARRLLALSRRQTLVWDRSGALMTASTVPAGSVNRAAAWGPRGRRLAIVRSRRRHSQIVLVHAQRKRSEQRLFSAPGRLGAPAWSPDGTRLLVPWADADQWLFLRTDGRAPVTAVGRIASQFTPGAETPSFPGSVAWCC